MPDVFIPYTWTVTSSSWMPENGPITYTCTPPKVLKVFSIGDCVKTKYGNLGVVVGIAGGVGWYSIRVIYNFVDDKMTHRIVILRDEDLEKVDVH